MVEDPKLARHYWPLKNGVFNEVEYLSRQELIGDIQLILEDAINSEMGIDVNDYGNYSAVLVIPDLFEKSQIYELTRLLFQDMGFSKVAFLQAHPHPLMRLILRNRCPRHTELDSPMHVWWISGHKQRR